MNPSLAQTLCQIGVTIFTIFALLCGFGVYYFGNKVTKQQHEEIIGYFKKIEIKGDKQLVEQIEKPDKWDFSVGTIVFWIKKEAFLNKDKLSLLIKSEDNQASIEFLKDFDNKVYFTYIFPSIGKIVRETQISYDDIKERGIFFAFTWDLKKAETKLYINAEERK